MNDVDEDLEAIAHQGGRWIYDDEAGLMMRFLNNPPDYSTVNVASEYVDISGLIIYYTDWHDVDENAITVSSQIGAWGDESRAGLTARNIGNDWFTAVSFVASSVDIREIHSYTDQHDVDENMTAVTSWGGMWSLGVHTGVMYRNVSASLNSVYPHVASKYNKNSTPVTESRVLYELFKFVDKPNYGRIMYCCVYRTLKC